MNDTPYSLKDILRQLVELADAKPGTPIHWKLKGGLNLNIKREGEFYEFGIFRVDVFPSVKEWQVVVASWPWKLFHPAPVSTVDGKFHWMSCRVRVQLPLAFGQVTQ